MTKRTAPLKGRRLGTVYSHPGSIAASDAVIILFARPESVAARGQKSPQASVRGIR